MGFIQADCILKMEAADSAENLWAIYQTTRCHNSEDHNLKAIVRNEVVICGGIEVLFVFWGREHEMIRGRS
jgi:hypothetical protein